MKQLRSEDMGGKVLLNIAMSLDGYIATEKGDFDWIHGQGDNILNTANTFEFQDLLKSIKVVAMGRNNHLIS